MPVKRAFIPIHHPEAREVLADLRVLQFNMLADGLSGLRADLGGFSKAKREYMDWSSRSIKLMYELLQYDPDVITLQECDHYYDFFLPELAKAGYDGMFAPKPASACLEVSDRSDGCAIFLKRDKIRVVSSEVRVCVICSYVPMLICSYVHMFICSYVLMFICCF
jgi:mRNA deadenylase 3'-5' endonuclease subunit Ccr4